VRFLLAGYLKEHITVFDVDTFFLQKKNTFYDVLVPHNNLGAWTRAQIVSVLLADMTFSHERALQYD